MKYIYDQRRRQLRSFFDGTLSVNIATVIAVQSIFIKAKLALY